MKDNLLVAKREMMDAADLQARKGNAQLALLLQTKTPSKKIVNWLNFLICFGNEPKSFVRKIKSAIRYIK